MTETAAHLQVACPQCGAGYAVPLVKIGPHGRKLKCAACGHLWVVRKARGDEERGTREEAALPQTEGIEDVAPETVAEVPPPPENAPEPAPESVPEPDFAPIVRLETLTKPTPWWHPYLIGEQKWFTLALGLAVLGMLGAAVALWQRLHPAPAPQGVPLYQSTDYAAPQIVAAPRGVVLHEIQAATEETPQGVVLTLQGQVANTSAQTQALPTLRAELIDDAEIVQDFQVVSLVTTTLPAQMGLNFKVSFTNPLGTGWRLNWIAR